MGTQSVQMKGVLSFLSWLVRWACRAGTRDFCSALAAVDGPVQNAFSSPYTISIPLSSSPTSPNKVGRQPCWIACFLVCVSGNESAKSDTVKVSIFSLISFKFLICFIVKCPFYLVFMCPMWHSIFCRMQHAHTHTIFLISVLAEFIRPTLC